MFSKDVLSVSDWLIIFLLMLIPLVNFIVIMMLLFSPDTNQGLKNYMFAFLVVFFLSIFVGFGLFLCMIRYAYS